jgi:hypothetical protein
MSDHFIAVPEDIYSRASVLALEQAIPVEQVILNLLRASFPALPSLPPDEEAELAALQHLSDDALWTITRSRMADSLQNQMQALMDKNSTGEIDANELAELESLVERGQRLMVRKSEAAALLTRRGYRITPDDLKSDEP